MEYTSKNLSALGDLEAIRLRKGMYIGEADNPAHLFQEAFDNALDESIGGYSKLTVVKVDTHTHTYTIQDFGRGIPLGTMEVDLMGTKFQKSTLEVLTSKTHSGGKFGNGGYKLSSGLHGVGLCCLAALSDSFEINVSRISDDSKKMTEGRIHYRNGVLQGQEYKPLSALKDTGTTITFRADKEIFEKMEIPRSYLINKCKIASAFNNKVELYFDGVQEDVSSKGLEDLLDLEEFHPLHEPIKFNIKDPTTGEFMEICLIYSSDIKSSIKGFTNLLYNSAGGTHTRLLERAIKEAWSEVLPKDHILKEWDTLLGLRGVVAVFIQETSFSSQTKERLNVPNGNLKVLMDSFKDELVTYLRKNGSLREKLISKFVAFRDAQNRLLASKEIQGLVKVAEVSADGKVRRKTMVPGLAECSTKDVEQTELFICEGESAKGSLMSCRDTKYHGILAIRGKIQNTSYLDVKDALKSQEVLNIVNAIGCGVSEASDNTKSRYGKVIVACDADVDGLHIQVLVICALINLVPDMVKAGKVYIAESALYGYTKNKEFYPAWNQEDIPQGMEFTRFKGLGELNPSQTYTMFMDEEKRRLLRIQYPEDINAFNNLVSLSKKHLLEEEGILVDIR